MGRVGWPQLSLWGLLAVAAVAGSILLYPESEPRDYDVPAAFPEGLKAPRAQPKVAPRADEARVRAVDRMWRALFRRAGARYEEARVFHFSEPGAEPCAPMEDGLLGLYCREERAIFLAVPGDDVEWLYVIAHEVGHHVQELRGTFAATDRELSQHTGDADDLHLREELQADCYAGVWAHAARIPRPHPSFYDLAADEPGTPSQRRRWLLRGRRTGRPAACDTFAVASP